MGFTTLPTQNLSLGMLIDVFLIKTTYEEYEFCYSTPLVEWFTSAHEYWGRKCTARIVDNFFNAYIQFTYIGEFTIRYPWQRTFPFTPGALTKRATQTMKREHDVELHDLFETGWSHSQLQKLRHPVATWYDFLFHATGLVVEWISYLVGKPSIAGVSVVFSTSADQWEPAWESNPGPHGHFACK